MKFFLPISISDAIDFFEKEAKKQGFAKDISLKSEGCTLTMIIHGFVNSEIIIVYHGDATGTEFEVVKERLSLLHRPFRGHIISYLKSAISSMKGTIIR